MRITRDQLAAIGRAAFLGRLDERFVGALPDFAALDPEERVEILTLCAERARDLNLKSELAIASYALAAWWLGYGFEEESPRLLRVLASTLPETRRMAMLNDWVSARIARPDAAEAADRAMIDAHRRTAAWGERG